MPSARILDEVNQHTAFAMCYGMLALDVIGLTPYPELYPPLGLSRTARRNNI
jgi:hypothetical protein